MVDSQSSVAFSTPKAALGSTVARRYKLDACLGKGGMGVVYRARDLDTGVAVAVKLVALTQDRVSCSARVLREASILRQMTSEHAVRVFDVGILDDGTPYIVLELLRGRDLGQVLERTGPLDLTHAVDLLLQACEAIAEAHTIGIVHRDLKPDNLYLTTRRDGSECVKVIDFGIAKTTSALFGAPGLTQPNFVMGSPRYMAPEQMEALEVVDQRADIWSVGVMLHELVTGRAPFEGDSLIGIFHAILAGPPRSASSLRADLPEEIDAVIAKCLAVEVADRYQSIAELAEALEPFASPVGSASVLRLVKSLPPGIGIERISQRAEGGMPGRKFNAGMWPRSLKASAALAAVAAIALALARPSFRKSPQKPPPLVAVMAPAPETVESRHSPRPGGVFSQTR